MKHFLRLSLAATSLFVNLFGCGGATPNNVSSGTTKALPSATSAVSSAKPDIATATRNDKETEKKPASISSPFHLVADVDYKLELQRLGKTAVIYADGQLLPIRDNTITFEPKMALSADIRGDGMAGAFQSLSGSFPDLLFASVVRPSGRTGLTELYKWNGTKWTNNYSTNESTFVLDIQPWQNGTLLMVETHSMTGEMRFSALPKNSSVFLPEPHGANWNAVFSLCASGFVADSFRTSPAGFVFMLGFTCTSEGNQDGKNAVKRWSPGDSKGKIDVLADVGQKGLTLVNIAILGEKEAYLAANTTPSRFGPPKGWSPYLAHFDGSSWKSDTLPFSDTITSFDADSKGKIWVVSDKGAIYSREPAGAWTEVVLPGAGKEGKTISASAVWARGPGDEWIVGTYESRHVVLHSGPNGEMAQLPDLETMADVASELVMPTPLTWHCRTPFVLIYTLSKVAPPDFDYPATREALKGHKEFEGAQFVEFKRLDKRFMGAFVPGVEVGKSLVEFVKKKVPNSTPQLVCHNPKPSRTIEIDLSR